MTVRWALAGSAAALVLASCGGVSGAMTTDDAVEVVEPSPMEVVMAPYEIRWRGDAPGAGSFAVFLDREPIAPGRSIADAFEDECDGTTGCPDELFLSARGVYLTDDNAVDVPLLAPRAGVDGAPPLEVHRATVVVVDGDGVRQGERSWTTEFRVER